jgi:hypothetical protein
VYNDIFFDHTFTEDLNHQFVDTLEEIGFSPEEKIVEHPGQLFCKFIKFGKQYLEFADSKEGGIGIERPGISLGAKSLDLYKKKIKNDTSLEFEFIHKNYNWKENRSDSLPGWNFLVFKNTNLKSFEQWFIEYEARPDSSQFSSSKVQNHPNGVTAIKGVEIELNPSGVKFFEQVFGERVKEEMILPDGFTFYFRFHERDNRYISVVLKTHDFNKTKSFIKDPELIDYQGSPSIRVKNPRSKTCMWDLIIQE